MYLHKSEVPRCWLIVCGDGLKEWFLVHQNIILFKVCLKNQCKFTPKEMKRLDQCSHLIHHQLKLWIPILSLGQSWILNQVILLILNFLLLYVKAQARCYSQHFASNNYLSPTSSSFVTKQSFECIPKRASKAVSHTLIPSEKRRWLKKCTWVLTTLPKGCKWVVCIKAQSKWHNWKI